MRYWVCAAVALSASCAWAQDEAVMEIVTPLPLARAAVEPVTRGGAVATATARFEQRSLLVQKDVKVRDVLAERGVVVNAKTMPAMRQLNPHIRNDGTVPAGTRLTYFATPTPTQVPIDMAGVARYSVQPQVDAAQQARQRTAALPANAYERPADVKQHRALVSDLDSTARLVEQRAGSMNARDLALSTYYLSQANADAQVLSTRSLQPISADAVTHLRSSVTPLQALQARLKAGKSPFGYRPVMVTVKARPGQPAPPRLRVYVLPGGVFDRPENFDVSAIRQWLTDLTFQELTSPSRWSVAQGEMRVWVGPDAAYDAMAKRILERAPIAFTPLHIAADGAPEQELQFNAPGDIVRP